MGTEPFSFSNGVYRVVEQSFFYRIYEKAISFFERNKKIRKKEATRSFPRRSVSAGSVFRYWFLEKKRLSLDYMVSSKCVSLLDRLFCICKHYSSASMEKSYFQKQIQEVKEGVKVHPILTLAIIALSAISTKLYALKNAEGSVYILIYLGSLGVIWFGGYLYLHLNITKDL